MNSPISKLAYFADTPAYKFWKEFTDKTRKFRPALGFDTDVILGQLVRPVSWKRTKSGDIFMKWVVLDAPVHGVLIDDIKISCHYGLDQIVVYLDDVGDLIVEVKVCF